MPELDDLDKKILDLLMKDGRMPIAQIAQQIDLSRVGARERINKLKKRGVITKFIPLIDNIAIGYTCSAFLDIEVGPQSLETVAEELSKLEEIMVVYLMTGNVSLHAHALMRDNKHLAEFLRTKIYRIPGINNVNVSVMLKRYKSELNLL